MCKLCEQDFRANLKTSQISPNDNSCPLCRLRRRSVWGPCKVSGFRDVHEGPVMLMCSWGPYILRLERNTRANMWGQRSHQEISGRSCYAKTHREKRLVRPSCFQCTQHHPLSLSLPPFLPHSLPPTLSPSPSLLPSLSDTHKTHMNDPISHREHTREPDLPSPHCAI